MLHPCVASRSRFSSNCFTAVATAFRVQDSIIRIVLSLVRKRRYLVPETAVISSAMVAMVSGSGAANVAKTM